MSFPRNDYLDWYIPRMRAHDGAINLHASGVEALGEEYLHDLSGNPWEAIQRFEAALAEWLGIPAEETLFAPGATGGNLLALLTFGRLGSTVLAETPMYEPMWRQAGRLNRLERFARRPEGRWRLPLAELAERITPEVSLVAITEPHNPSGVRSPRQDVLALAEMASKAGAVLLVNEVYRGFAGSPSYHGQGDNIVIVSSLSKFLGAYWARLGWLSARGGFMDRLRSGHMNMGMGASPGALVGLSVVRKAPALATAAQAMAAAGRETVDLWVHATPGLTWTPPMGPGFGAVELPVGMDDVAFAEHLHDNCGVLVVPGRCFDAPGTLRLSWLQAGNQLEKGLDTIARELSRRG
jgi:aspartate/methionine/tyrosine aminotransferase